MPCSGTRRSASGRQYTRCVIRANRSRASHAPGTRGRRSAPLLHGLGCEPALAEREVRPLAVDARVEDDLVAPEPVHVGERLLALLEVEIATVVDVAEEQRPGAAEVGVF